MKKEDVTSEVRRGNPEARRLRVTFLLSLYKAIKHVLTPFCKLLT